MFVTYHESSRIPRGNHKFNGMTVSILKAGVGNMYWVGAYTAAGWKEWDAHIDELMGFEGI